MPTYHYGISGVAYSLSLENPLFTHPLPQNRHFQVSGKSMECGVFLEGVGRFLDAHCDRLASIYGEEIDSVQVVLEKHGAFYHPCRVVVNGHQGAPLVVNGAVTETAVKTLQGEVAALQVLWNKGLRDIPHVYFSAETRLSGEQRASFFVAPWFEGFCEFHWSKVETVPQILIWKDGGERCILDKKEVEALFYKIAVILTRAYDVDHFTQIFPWHHAAGDFVVFRENGEIDVRLITVRQYGNLYSLDPHSADLRDKLDGLLYFFWNMLLRMRLDRLDGVGELFFAPDDIVFPSISGFLKGLTEKADTREDIAMLVQAFPEIIRAMGREGVLDATREVIEAYNSNAPELPIIYENLKAHSDLVFQFFSDRKEASECF